MSSTRAATTWVAIVMSACNSESSHLDTVPTVDSRPVERSERAALPITGGALLVTADGAMAVATDPDRDLIHVVDLVANRALAAIVLPEGARPFRAASDGAGLVHATLRGTGEVATVDPERGTLLGRTAVCAAPRGIAFDGGANVLHVACAGGELVSLDATTREVVARRSIALDLRDVVMAGDRVLVSRFRTAEIYEVQGEGPATRVAVPESARLSHALHVPNTAWRTLATADGGWLMLHQLADTTPLPASDLSADLLDGEDDAGGGGGGGSYAELGLQPRCEGPSSPALTAALPGGALTSLGGVPGIAMAVDVAIAPDGRHIVVASPSQHERAPTETSLSLVRASLDDFVEGPEARCRSPQRLDAAADFVAVAFDHDGQVLALSRETPRLYRFIDDTVDRVIELSGDTLRDTGHDLFHLDTGGGIACATCHAEGGDDGITWSFAEVGPRRTIALDVGLAGTEPFHWSGDLPDMPALIEEVRHRRMGGVAQSPEHTAALAEWLFELPREPALRAGQDAEAGTGEALFGELGCARCHSGNTLTSNASSDLGAGPIQIPSLHGVAMRPPYMHDGRAADLVEAVIDMLQATPEARTPSADEVAAIVAYLETL
jgi:mono/diheme cytochrome c family protein